MKKTRIHLFIFFTVALFISKNLGQEIHQVDNFVYPHESIINEYNSDKVEIHNALLKKTTISDFRVNEQIGNSLKNFLKSAINNNGISVVVWSDQREANSNVYAQLADSNGNLIGSNIKVNSSDIGQTFEQPDVAVNEDEQFLVVWRSTDTGIGIDGQLISEDGNLINENFEISDDNLNSLRYYPAIATNRKEFVIVWSDKRNGSFYDIYAQRLNKDGSKIGENFIVNSDSQGTNKIYPDVAMAENGNIAVTWYANSEGNKVYSSVIKNNEFPGEQTLISNITATSSNNFSPTIALSNYDFLIAWSRYMDGDYNIVYQLIDSMGTKIEENFILNDNLHSTQLYPNAASNNNGGLFISWLDYRNNLPQIYSQKIVNGELNGVNFKVSEDDLNDTKNNVNCAINDKGQIITSWLNYSGTTEYQIYVRILDSTKTPVTQSFRLDNDENSSSQSDPEITVFDDGNFIIVWSDSRNRTPNIFFQLYSADGTPVGKNQVVGATNYKIYPKVLKLKDNNFMVAWKEYYRGIFNQYELVTQKYFSTGETIGDKFVISSDEIKSDVGYIDVASNSDGEFVMTWERRINGINRIFAKKK